jgi:protein-S-isoprenylcysteine O-methyltransferase Ste14
MKASALEFRLRYCLHFLIYMLGIFAPWNPLVHLDAPGPNAHTWGVLAALLAKTHLVEIGTAFDVLLIAAIVLALAGAMLRTWGSAYLGSSVVQDGAMHTGGQATGVIAAGPYRHLRNPLYLGTILATFALALPMPPSGAIFAIAAIVLLQFRLIFGEEEFLTRRLGPAYIAFCKVVPRLLPSLRPRVAASGERPRWLQSFLGEIYFWGLAADFAIAGWHYNAYLILKWLLVALGVSLVARAFLPKPVS